MSGHTKKRKIAEENRGFKECWTNEFFFVEDRGNIICLICNEKVSWPKRDCIKRHYKAKHSKDHNGLAGPQREDKAKELMNKLGSQQKLFVKQGNTSKAATEASFKVAAIIARRMKPFSDGEFVKECMLAALDVMCPEKVAVINKISLSNDTVTRRIDSLSKNLTEQLHSLATKFSYFALALDESTDVKDTAQLAIFVRGIDTNFNVTEELLTVRSMKSSTTGEDIFNELKAAMNDANLDFNRLIGIATDGAPSMLGTGRGLQGHVMAELDRQGLSHEHLVWCHCIIHQEALCAKIFEVSFKEVMSKVVVHVNHIRSHAMNHRQFRQFLLELDASYGDVIYFSGVRWLSRGQTLQRFWVLREELSMFFAMKGIPAPELEDQKWLCDLAFLVDITEKLNTLNVAMQGRNKLVHELFAHIKAFQTKLQLWQVQLERGNLAHFPSLKSQKEHDGGEFSSLRYAAEICKLQKEFDTRFKEFRARNTDFELFSVPFNVDVSQAPIELQLELCDLQASLELKGQFLGKELVDFYKSLPRATFPNLTQNAQKFISLFGSTYCAEQFFSKMKNTKSSKRNALTDAHLLASLRIASTHLQPDFKAIMNEQKEFQSSH